MTYTKTTWAVGDKITASKLNNMENGIADASGGGVSPLLCTPSLSGSIFSLDKTFKEIKEAFEAGSPIHILDELDGIYTTVTIIILQGRMVKDEYGNQFAADSDDGYPYFEI